MHNIFKKYITFLFLLLFFFIILTENKLSLYFACNGLTLWYQRMIPALFPFMVISGILLRTNLSSYLAQLVKPLLSPIFHLNNHCIYCIVIGFMCGFPMGAKMITDSLLLGKISEEEAKFLLSFCNNIGPLYIISYIAPLYSLTNLPLVLLIIYGIPLFYGFLLRYTKFSHLSVGNPPAKKLSLTTLVHFPVKKQKKESIPYFSSQNFSLLEALDASITSSIDAITLLGGYMIFFNVMMIFPYLLKNILSHYFYSICCACLEITGGIMVLSANSIPYQIVLILLPLGGASCMAQTYTIIKTTNLSILTYFFHKVLQVCITIIIVHMLIPMK